LAHVKNLTLLRKLDLGWTKITDAGLHHLDNLLQLESLNICNTPITDVGIQHVARLSKLKSLDITGTKVTEAVLAHLKDWPKLKHLRHDFPLGDQGLALLSRFPQLRNPERAEAHGQVHLRGVTDEGMAQITVIGKPEFLCIDRAQIKTGWNHLDQMPSVEGLNLKDTVVSREGMAAISRIPKLRILEFYGARISGGWEFLAQVKKLDPILSKGTAWHPDGLAALTRRSSIRGRISKSDGMTLGMIGRSCGPRVRQLFLYPGKVGINLDHCPQYPEYIPFVIDCEVRGSDMKALADFSSVELLEIVDGSLAAAALPFVQAMPSLKELRICCPVAYVANGIRTDRSEDEFMTPFEDRNAGPLFEALRDPTSLKNLKRLAINVPSDDDLALLDKLPQLQSLRLCFDRRITDVGLAHLRGLASLDYLDLSGTRVTDAGVGRLRVLSNLRGLELVRTEVGDAGLRRLRGMTKLTWLEVGESRVTDEGVKELQQALPSCRIIK
jgi:internalin A